MDAQGFPAGVDQRFVIAQSLGTDQRTERQAFGWDIKIHYRLSRDYDEQRVVWSAFVELTRRVLEARTKARSYGVACLGANSYSHLLQFLDHLFVARQIRIDGDIPMGLRLRQVILQDISQRRSIHT